MLGGRRFAFSMLVHTDASSPMIDFLASSSVLQARPVPLYCPSLASMISPVTWAVRRDVMLC